jgi:hypothetical protein
VSSAFEDLLKGRVASPDILRSPTSGPGGVTPGGFANDTDSTPWYVKHHKDPEHGHIEHLANQIYRKLGHNAPHSTVLYDPDKKRPVYLSKQIEDFKTLNETGGWKKVKNPKVAAARFTQGVAADALIGNTDLHSNNVGFVRNASPVRIDNGAALTHTAWGDRRDTYGHEVSGFTNIGYSEGHRTARQFLTGNEDADANHDLFTHPKMLRREMSKIEGLKNKHGSWESLVSAIIPSASAGIKKDATRVLNQRSSWLEDYANESGRRRDNPVAFHGLRGWNQTKP